MNIEEAKTFYGGGGGASGAGSGNAGRNSYVKYAPLALPGSRTGYMPDGWPISFRSTSLIPSLTSVRPEPEFGSLRAKLDLKAAAKQDIADVPSQMNVNPQKFTPTYMPIDTKGLTMADVVSRRKFIEPQINRWRNMHVSRFLCFAFVGAAVLLFPVSAPLAALCGIGAGKMYGDFKSTEWYIKNRLRVRTMMFTG